MKVCKFRKESLFVLLFLIASLSLFSSFVLAAPDGPDSILVTANETKGASSAAVLNTTGGYITTINITATSQNPRWKAFVGQLIGSFTLDDATGSTIYDWSVASVSGEVYATRNSSTPVWGSIACATTAALETENTALSHSSSDDNITATFSDSTHEEFFVGTVNITTDTCPTLNTYVNNATQDTSFEEIALYDGGQTIVYATIVNQNTTGFDSVNYDFQMIVPEDGSEGFSSSTAYYLYVELS